MKKVLLITSYVKDRGASIGSMRIYSDLIKNTLASDYILFSEYAPGTFWGKILLMPRNLQRIIIVYLISPVFILIKSIKYDCVVCTDHAAIGSLFLISFFKKVVITVHDVTWYKKIATEREKFFKKTMLILCLGIISRARYIVSDSQSTKKDLIELLGDFNISLPIVHVIYPPLRTMGLGATSLINRDTLLIGIYSKLILHVGSSAFYKNRKHILSVARHIESMSSDFFKNILFVLAGSEIDDLELGGEIASSNVLNIIDPSDDDLIQLYSSCDGFLFPSITEGFGWPPIEAQHFGKAVVSTDKGSLKEVLADTAKFISGDSVEETIDAINSILYISPIESQLSISNSLRFNHSVFSSQYIEKLFRVMN